MPDGAMELEPGDIDWHDGNLVDVRVSGFMEEQQELILLLDLYPDAQSSASRRRYRCTAVGLTRIQLHGSVRRLIRHRGAGNVDFMHMDSDGSTEIMTIGLFGGLIEAEAASFHLTKVEP
jgi:hypothetical protein